MIGGAVVAALFDLKFELGGYLMILSNDFFTAAYGVSIKRALNLKIPQMRYAPSLPPPPLYLHALPPTEDARETPCASKMFPAKLLHQAPDDCLLLPREVVSDVEMCRRKAAAEPFFPGRKDSPWALSRRRLRLDAPPPCCSPAIDIQWVTIEKYGD